MPSLSSPIRSLKGMRTDWADKFESLGLTTLKDALFYFPFRHEDWRQRITIASVQPGEKITILGTVAHLSSRRGWRKSVNITEARVTDSSKKSLYIIWYNQPYMAKTLKIGDQIYASGQVTDKAGKMQMANPTWERPSADPLHEKLVPVYRTTEGLSQRQIRNVMKQAVDLAHLIPETLPTTTMKKFDLLDRPEAVIQIHFPATPEQAAAAVRRLKFDELLAWQISWRQEQQNFNRHPARSFPFQEMVVRSFVQSLPYTLTDDQRVAAWQILQDMAKSQPMSRLLQGDVGSGKTVVAAIAADNVVKQAGQVAFLTPTILLAEQHYRTFTHLLSHQSVRIALLTGNQSVLSTSDERLEPMAIKDALRQGDIDIVIGTHALIQNSITFKNLGLVVVDEQQRFGVAQRDALLQAAAADQPTVPHFLSLTATPIPRTLALFVAGELSITTLKHKPAGRGQVVTEVIPPAQRSTITTAISQTITAGQQVFIITPLIEESDTLGVRAATTEFDRLKEELAHSRVGLVHGAMPAADRLAVLEHFRQGDLDVLVGTTVLEVGLDVPNATLIVIEGAERFGLAQLHQLRGRIGRGTVPGRCLLATDQNSPAIRQRLQQVAAINDGFELAELDLQERGGGELYGLRQSGLPDWQLATLTDTELLVIARSAAEELLATNPSLAETLTGAETLPGLSHRE